MPLDGLVFAALVHDLNQSRAGFRVHRVTQPDPDLIVLHVRRPGDEAFIHCSLDQNEPVLWASADPGGGVPGRGPAGAHPSAFCMLLRKHLESSRLVAVRQRGWERIVHLDFQSASDWSAGKPWTLTLELIPRRANAILVDPRRGLIVDAWARRPGRVDERAPGAPYTPPPPRDRLAPDAEPKSLGLVFRLAPASRPLARHLAQHVEGLTVASAREILVRAGIDPDGHGTPGEEGAAKAARLLHDLASRCRRGDVEPAVRYAFGEGTPVPDDVWVLPPAAPGPDVRWTVFDAMASAVAEVMEKRRRMRLLGERRARLERAVRTHLKRARRKLANRRRDLTRAESTARYKRWADLLMANAHRINSLPGGRDSVAVTDWYAEEAGGSPPTVEIPLDPSMSPMANARRYYRLYSKYNQAFRQIAAKIREAEEEVAYLEHVELALQWAPGPRELDELEHELIAGRYIDAPRPGRGRPRPERPRLPAEGEPYRFVLEDGSEVRVGRNNRQNDRLTMGWARPDDIWLHARGIPGAHVILRPAPSPSPELDPAALEQAAALAAWFSRGRDATRVPVDYTRRRYVRKPKGARPGMVVYEREQTLHVTPDPDAIARLQGRAPH